jgi:uncharacterized damage-inducible protein DinB
LGDDSCASEGEGGSQAFITGILAANKGELAIRWRHTEEVSRNAGAVEGIRFEDRNKRRINMSIAQSLLAEFEAQAPITRKFLERLPEDKLTWKPHEKSMSAGQLAYHLAFVPGGVVRFVQNNSGEAPKFANFPQPESRQEILKMFEESIVAVRSLLPKFDDAAMKETWRLVADGQEVLAQPRAEFLRDVMFSHWYQHRGQFSVYLRILNVAVPASWGPSADEPPAFTQKAKSA